MNKDNENYRCIIIGAETAGLEAAYELIKLGITPLVIDLADEMERRALSVEYGLRPYFKDPEMSEKIDKITGNIRHLKINTGEKRWALTVTSDDIMAGREFKIRNLFRKVVETMGVPVKDNLDNIKLKREKGVYHITTERMGQKEEFTPDIVIVTREVFAEKNSMLNSDKRSFFLSMEADFENVYGKSGDLEYFYAHDALFPGGYVLIEQLSSHRAHLSLRFSNESSGCGGISPANYMEWIRDNIPITASRLATAIQISDTISGKKYLYDENIQLSGDSLLIIGDAAGISEPLFGNSYPYNLYSGRVAAHVAESAFECANFKSSLLSRYDEMLRSTINPVMESFRAVRNEIFSSADKLNEFIADVNSGNDSGNQRFVELMFKYLYRKGLLQRR